MNTVLGGLTATENKVFEVSCKVHYTQALVKAAVGAFVLLVASVARGILTKRNAVEGRIKSSSDSHVLEAHPGATVAAKTVTIERTGKENVQETVYDVTFEDGQTVSCAFRPDLQRGFPKSVADGTLECQRPLWNTCTLQVEYAGAEYGVKKLADHSCDSEAGNVGTFYYGGGNLAAHNIEAYARAGLQFVRMLCACLVVWELYRLTALDGVCGYRLREDDLTSKTPGVCSQFVKAYNKALKLDQMAEVYDVAEDAARAGQRWAGKNSAGNAVATAAKGTAWLGGLQNDLRLWYHALDADYQLWRCAGGKGGRGGYAAILVGGGVVTFAAASVLGTQAFKALTPSSENVADLAWAYAVGLLTGILALMAARVVHRGVNRRAVGLSFLDWPRMVL